MTIKRYDLAAIDARTLAKIDRPCTPGGTYVQILRTALIRRDRVVQQSARTGLEAIYTDRGATADDAQVFVCGIVRALQAEIEASR